MAASSLEDLSRAVSQLGYDGSTAALDDWTAEDWRAVLLDLPLDERTYLYRLQRTRVEVIEALWKWWPSGQTGPAAGYLGFLLLTLVTMHCSDRVRYQGEEPGAAVVAGKRGDALCTALAIDPDVRSAIVALYDPALRGGSERAREEWAGLDFRTLEFHRHGTTSIIFKGNAKEAHGSAAKFALKCLIYPYERIPAIAEATRGYREEFGRSGSADSPLVRAWASHDSWILMDFVKGDTLAQVLRELQERRREPKREIKRRVDLEQLRRLGGPLLRAMVELEGAQRHHHDLTPSNIIVEDDERGVRFRLIDLGVNYLHLRALSGAERGEADFVAPEVKETGAGGDESDLYSLGMLLIAIAGIPRRSEHLVPDQFYTASAGLARILEDLVDTDPDRRLLVTGVVADEPRYAQIEKLLLREVEVLAAGEADRPDGRLRLPRQILPGAATVARQRRIAAVRRKQVKETGGSAHLRQARYLMWWAIGCAVLWWATMAIVLTWWARDLGIDWAAKWFDLANQVFDRKGEGLVFFDDIRAADYPIPDPWGNLPVRIAAFTYALPSYRFYLYLLAEMTPFSGIPRHGMRQVRTVAAAVAMRTAAIWPAVLVLVPTLVQRDWWMLACPIGVVSAALFISGLSFFGRDAIERAKDRGLSTVSRTDAPLGRLASWEPMAWMYCVPVVVIGPLLYLGVIQDELVYVCAIGLINVGIWFLKDTVGDAPNVRMSLNRAILAAERLDRLEQRERAAAVPDQPAALRERIGPVSPVD
ncbi:protein kinase domain-containing protein [Glycomyces dulcitolivorans]|uniref:protein kinase domain-containing protein n=1 Tax=Glycomyces dulcitolivorans TaxID=2200759 RepID=UPI000DD4665E|nr:protein kinase [Glycomyces dulcitolivorans]